MQIAKQESKSLVDTRMEEHPNETFVKRDGSLFCQACNSVIQHFKFGYHMHIVKIHFVSSSL